jgi:electron-transferring-flavoprotein dehydrogenase
LNLDDGREPQLYSVGVKELWELPDDRYPTGRVTHTLGFPSDAHTYGGGWIYGLQNRVLSLGYVTGLDYKDPLIDPHAEFQLFKTHPYLAKLLEGGKMIRRKDDRCRRLFRDAAHLSRRGPAHRRLCRFS